MNTVLFDHPEIRINLLPFTYTRPVSEIRVGILTITEKWSKYLTCAPSFLTDDYLSKKYTCVEEEQSLLINGAVLPSPQLTQKILQLKNNQLLIFNDMPIAWKGSSQSAKNVISGDYSGFEKIEPDEEPEMITQVYDIFIKNGKAIRDDFALLTKGRVSEKITDPHTMVYGEENVFVEKNATIRAAVINAENGPVYIGENAEISEGSMIRGAFALCHDATLNMGAKIRGDATVGPFCKVGGEVSNSIFFGYSNKGHDGFIGNSVVGEWCNLGADTNTSNLKNNYADVKIWNYAKNGFWSTGRQFCGLMMGDHSKCGINTMFNTGTVVGVSANIYGSGFPRNFIPSFSWGGASGFMTFKMPKVLEVAQKVMERRNITLTQVDIDILNHIFEQSKQYRIWDK